MIESGYLSFPWGRFFRWELQEDPRDGDGEARTYNEEDRSWGYWRVDDFGKSGPEFCLGLHGYRAKPSIGSSGRCR